MTRRAGSTQRPPALLHQAEHEVLRRPREPRRAEQARLPVPAPDPGQLCDPQVHAADPARHGDPQDMIVLMLTEKGRVETTNYCTERIPSNLDAPLFTKWQFANFYRAKFDYQEERTTR